MVFNDLYAQHWQRLHTNNQIHPIFATIRYRANRFKSGVVREGMLHMILKMG